MKWIYGIIVCFCLLSCKKYKDPEPFTDSRINTKYCNDPSAINFNWDFPGIPDNSVCVYPSQIYNGSFLMYDTIINYLGETLATDTFSILMSAIDTTRIHITGFCGNQIYKAHANRFLSFTLDSTLGNGQLFCNNKDTISGGAKKSGLHDTIPILWKYYIQTDTGVVTHIAQAVKK